MQVRFRLNGNIVQADTPPTTTLLDWLRETRGMTGTKEGCNEGDCGACTVMVTDEDGPRALNACILFMGQLDGRAIRTVEGISGPDGALHPVQRAMIDYHGSQCGFCTPGFVVSMATGHLKGRTDHDDQLAGNLCRCTGYAPIVRAARAAEKAPVPDWMDDAPTTPQGATARPETVDALAEWCVANPKGTLIAGATDVGLWVTKGLRELEPVCFLNGIPELRRIEVGDDAIRIGAGATYAALREAIGPHHPSFAELLRRFGSAQVRNAATVGGNIANGSPIGDGPPALIALGATLHLRHGAERREMPLEDFFVEYGTQDRQPGEFVEAVTLPRQPDRLSCQKVSKRFDQDISAVCGCFNVAIEDGVVARARIAFGGMAGIPKRATATETALLGQPLTLEGVEAAQAALDEDFEPLSDMRASARYRLAAAKGMLARLAEPGPSILEVSA